MTARRVALTVAAVVGLGAALYASIFPIAEIFTEVVVLRTWDADGSPRETRVTVVDIDGTPWVRGRPRRGWFRRVVANPRAELRRDGVWRPVHASVSRDPADAAAFEEAMVDTYGDAYLWVDFVARLSTHEVPVRLAPGAP